MTQEILRKMKSASVWTAALALATIWYCMVVAASAQSTQGKAPLNVSTTPQAGSPGRFVDITEKSGVRFLHQAPHTSRKYLIETMGSGVGLFDCDNDGRLDLYLVNGAPYSDPEPKGSIPQKTGPQYWNRMYHQKPDGTFEDITEKAGLQGVGYGMGVAVADYDNDGYEDIFVTSYGGNRLYHNNGDCTFTDVTDKAGVPGSGWSTSATWVDLDNDGRLDLVVDRYVTWDWEDVWCGEHREGYRAYCHPDVFQPISMLVYHNDGNGHFTEVSHKLGLDKPAKALGIAIADYDRDGRIDLFVANDSAPEFLFHQKPNGSFEEVGLESAVAVNADGQTYAGMGVDFADYDNDGWPDLVITDLANQRYASYHNQRDGTFDYASNSNGIGAITLLHSGWSLRFIDYDNDGWKDLLIAQGHDLDTVEKTSPNLHYREPMILLRNSGRKFVDVSSISGDVFTKPWVGRGMAIGDIDNDGRIDAVVTTNGGPAHILHNETANANHWITLHLTGHKSNRDGIGAAVKLTTSQGSQWVTATTSSGYLSSSDPRVHFGMGDSSVAESIEIHWPSGIVQTLTNVKADRQIQVDEPSAPGSDSPRH
ncbi:CRTAC1 family protein [Acidicapsa acidisoli]|uniref:CRTAC1 family protein n=1 Tax=Acidicapsa acidisoli TaxID=1615681 RepID=UPI0021E0C2D7|nr:CRTAC1 family protein [Acidicapsa acidisoli]